MRNKIKIITVVLFISVFIILNSCQQQKAEWKGKIEEINGITVVKNPKEPMYSEDVFGLEEELSIGGGKDQEEYIFSRIGHIAVDEDEKIYVRDQQEQHIKVFDKDGKYLMTIGRKGQGPGELGSSGTISVNQNVLMAHEMRRLSFFSLDGKFLRRVLTREIWALRARIDSKGNIVVEEGILGPENVRQEIKKFDSNMNLITEIASSPGIDPRKPFNPFMPRAYWLIDKDDNIVYGYPQDYELQIYNPEGRLIKKITKQYDPIEITEEEKKEEMKGAPPSIKFDFSKYRSAYNRFFLDDEGRIFVQTWEKKEDEEIYYHDVFDPEGKYIAKVSFKFRPQIWKKHKLYTIEEDEEGFQMVKRYKVTWRY
ncbi:hypothetical protein ES703_111441 [subsurface metagenome]